MKAINPPQEAKDRIEALFTELHNLCVEHGMPYVAGCITENDSTGKTKAVSAYIDGTVGLADSSLIGAAEMLKLDGVPSEVIQAIQSLGEPNNDLEASDTECDCPVCQLARSAAAGLH